LREVLEVLRVSEVMRCTLLCMLQAAEGGLYLLEVLGGARGAQGDALRATLHAMEGGLCLLEVVEVMRRVLPWMPWRVISVC